MSSEKNTKKSPSGKKRKKQSWGRKLLLGILALVSSFILLSVLHVTLLKWINPSLTYLMVARKVDARKEGKALVLHREWKDLDEISPEMVRAVIASEDNRFIEHNGFSEKGLRNAIREKLEDGRVKHGGSTISQQTAKNVFTTTRQNYVRKAFEFYYTFLIEKIWGKRRIMEVYLNIAEMGDGIFGAEAASQTYYHHSAKKMSRSEAALLAVSLPNPRTKYHVANPGPYMRKRQSTIVTRMGQLGKLGVVE